eukprot:4490608-Amphidinium_carterae.1
MPVTFDALGATLQAAALPDHVKQIVGLCHLYVDIGWILKLCTCVGPSSGLKSDTEKRMVSRRA